MPFRRLYLFLIISFLAAPSPVFADSPRVMVISGLQAPPYVMLDEKGKATGILVDLINQGLQPLNIQPVFKISNWARSFEEAKQGRADAIIPTIKSEDRETLFIFPAEPLTRLQMAFMKHPDADIAFTGDLDSLTRYRIGKIRKARVSPTFDEAVAQQKLQIEERTSFGLLALAVARNRLDLFAGDELMGLWGAAENGVLDEVETITPYLSKVPVYMAIGKSSIFADEAELISQALAEAKNHQDFRSSLAGYEKLLRKELFDNLIKHTSH